VKNLNLFSNNHIVISCHRRAMRCNNTGERGRNVTTAEYQNWLHDQTLRDKVSSVAHWTIRTRQAR